MDLTRKKLLRQITDEAGNVFYTYHAHWIIVNRLKTKQTAIKIAQIILTALSTGGFLTALIAGIPWLSWMGGLTSAISLALNLYTLNFNLPNEIKNHTDAANELWDVKNSFISLITDFEELSNKEIRSIRDSITDRISEINKKHSGTDDRAFAKAQKDREKYMFENGESAKLLGVED